MSVELERYRSLTRLLATYLEDEILMRVAEGGAEGIGGARVGTRGAIEHNGLRMRLMVRVESECREFVPLS